MEDKKVLNYLDQVLKNMPSDWLNLTTHRLDIYDEKMAKTAFLEQFETLFKSGIAEPVAFNELPTSYDYIRLGHPLSCVLEWAIARFNHLKPEHVISFSSNTTPILAVLRKNLLGNKKTQIIYAGEAPDFFDAEKIRRVYGYNFDLKQIDAVGDLSSFDGSTVFIWQQNRFSNTELTLPIVSGIDFFINVDAHLGSVLLINGKQNESYTSEIQHVRRRESIAMTPANCLTALKMITDRNDIDLEENTSDNLRETHKQQVLDSIKTVTGSSTKAAVGSSGLSVQYAIMMGLIDYALGEYKGKTIKFIVPPNCYGGTNDQARRVAACLGNVEIVDLPVDGDHDMVQSINTVLEKIAKEDAVPYIIAEIPTNPRVEVPDLLSLKAALSQERKTAAGETAIDPVFILDQTFCPNVHFLGEGEILSTVRTISYVSGSKFPSGGRCTAGYCVGNKKTEALMDKVETHLQLCDNEATDLQYELLAKQLPSMKQRIQDAYKNTREFVDFINITLPTAKINFVSEELAKQGFTPSVFSLDLPTKGNSDAERETYKRELNLKLIDLMITKIPNESKYCVSYGQLKGCYWTIPATSTQGTTKEGDKDYIARVALSPNMNLELHKKVFLEFVESI